MSWKFDRVHRRVVAVLLLAFCAAGLLGFGSAGAAQDQPDAQRFRPEPVAWAPCSETPLLECGTLELPVDYRKPHGESFPMAVIRAKATDPARRIGAFFTNPGGWSISGVNFVIGGKLSGAPIFKSINTRFDIVSFDPRGTNRSRAFDCDPELAPPPASEDEATLARYLDDYSRRVVKTCLQQNRQFALSMSTNNVARDMDVLRRALGEHKISYSGGSYGSVLGAVYASLFPERVRAMLLDAPVSPEFRDYWIEFRNAQTAGLELNLFRLDRLCAKDPACRLNETGVVATFDSVAAQLRAKPVTSPEGKLLNKDVMAGILVELFYSERNLPLIVEALADAQDGDYGLFFGLIGFGGSFNGADLARICNDNGTRRAAAEVLPIDEATSALYSRLTGRYYLSLDAARCAAWPAADPPVIQNTRGRTGAPIVLIGAELDAITPFEFTRSMAKVLGVERTVVRYRGSSHSVVTRGIPCIDRITEDYFFDLKTAPEGYSCAAQPISFAAAPASLQRSAVEGSGEWLPGITLPR